MSDECPYCGKEVEISHDEGWGLEQDEVHQYQCPHCEKAFVFTTNISVDHDISKAPCLNGGGHTWERHTICNPIKGGVRVHHKMKCYACGSDRDLTELEMMKVPT